MKFQTTFNIGPSQISDETYQDLVTFSVERCGEVSHRSEKFSEISGKAVAEMRKYFSVPDDYTILWGSSATEMMELCVRSLVRENSFHFTCGGFSERFYDVAKNLGKNAHHQNAVWGEPNDFEHEISDATELVTITHSETSTGVGVNPAIFPAIKEKLHDNQVLFIDATSIMGVVPVDISEADGWIFSVQKCFGLPAGLGVMICHQSVIEKSKEFRNPMGVLNMPVMAEKMQKNHQTIQTPNTLGIYVLGKQLERWNNSGGINAMAQRIHEKNILLTEAIDTHPCFNFLVQDASHRSDSVTVIEGSTRHIAEFHRLAKDNRMILGAGYGKLKATTARIANFPNISRENIQKLIHILNKIS